jgi:hypothetical protein
MHMERSGYREHAKYINTGKQNLKEKRKMQAEQEGNGKWKGGKVRGERKETERGTMMVRKEGEYLERRDAERGEMGRKNGWEVKK